MHSEWKTLLNNELKAPYMIHLNSFIEDQLRCGKEIYPKRSHIFNSLKPKGPKEIKVVIVGQDPYHKPGQAHGYSFSVPDGIKAPPSLRNIFKELENDLKLSSKSTDLSPWANQGVLLLNSILSVEKNKAGSHQKKGWEEFTNKILQIVNNEAKHCVFILWGSHAQQKGPFLNANKHLILSSPHPSPLSAYRGFFGSKPFSKANDFLESRGLGKINWQV